MAIQSMTIDPNALITGEQARDAIVALADENRKIVITNPTVGQFKIVSVERDATGKMKIDYDDVAQP